MPLRHFADEEEAVADRERRFHHRRRHRRRHRRHYVLGAHGETYHRGRGHGCRHWA